MDNKELIRQIEQQLDKLHMFKAEATDEIKEALSNLPKPALKEVLVLLKEAKTKQDQVIKQLTETDNDFPIKLKHFIQKNFMKAASKATKAEQESAEAILNKI